MRDAEEINVSSTIRSLCSGRPVCRPARPNRIAWLSTDVNETHPARAWGCCSGHVSEPPVCELGDENREQLCPLHAPSVAILPGAVNVGANGMWPAGIVRAAELLTFVGRASPSEHPLWITRRQ